MRRSYLLYLKHALLPVLIIFLSGILISRWQVKSQTPPLQTQSTNRGRMSEMIQNLKNSGVQFPEVNLSAQEINLTQALPMSQITQGKVFYLNDTTIAMMASEENRALTLKVPDPKIFGQDVSLELTKVDILAEGFQAKTASGELIAVNPSFHYRGSVKGIPGSLAVINIFENEVSGFYSLPDEGNFAVGKLKDTQTNQHLVIPESELSTQSYNCETKDDGVSIPLPNENDQSDLALPPPGARCIKVYIESDYDLFQNKGNNAQAVITYLKDVFTKSSAIFENDGIYIQLSGILVWNTESPYTGTDTSVQLLKKFRETRTSFTGDIGHLVALRGGGGIAPVGGLCNTNTGNRLCFSGINPTADIDPITNYSWTVNVFTHEMGHVMGSPHTHACAWNGNNTPIDGCFESGGTCQPGPLPAPGGGTIMSYCHLKTAVGINFSNGFGPQPAALIRNRISAATCLTECSTGTSCDYSIDHPSNNFPSQGGTDAISVTSNVGCGWTATSNDTWIKILSGADSVGNVPVSILVGANSSTVARTGTITIAGYTFAVNQAAYTPGSELITDGNFQYRTDFWNFSGAAMLQVGDYPRTGNAYAMTSRFNNESGTVYQNLTIPTTAVNPSLTFWFNISSQEFSTTLKYDNLYVEVVDNSTGSVTQLDTFSNLNNRIPGDYIQKGPYNLSAFKEKPIQIRFRSSADYRYYTAFRIADVSVR